MAAKRLGMPAGSFTVMHLDLASLNSVRRFVDAFRASGSRLDALVCNAAVYLPTAKEPTFTADGFELSVGTNHLVRSGGGSGGGGKEGRSARARLTQRTAQRRVHASLQLQACRRRAAAAAAAPTHNALACVHRADLLSCSLCCAAATALPQGHFLLANLLLEDLKDSPSEAPR